MKADRKSECKRSALEGAEDNASPEKGGARVTRRRGVQLDSRALRRVRAALTSLCGMEVTAVRSRLDVRRSVAQGIVDGTGLIIVDSALAKRIACRLLDYADGSKSAALRSRFDGVARSLGEKAYAAARRSVQLSFECGQWQVPIWENGVHLAPFFSPDGHAIAITVGDQGRFVRLTELVASDPQVMKELPVLPPGVHYAPWRPAKGFTAKQWGRTMIAIGPRRELVAAMDVHDDDIVGGYIEARRQLEVILTLQVESAPTAYRDPYDDGNDCDLDDCGEDWKRPPT